MYIVVPLRTRDGRPPPWVDVRAYRAPNNTAAPSAPGH